MGEKIRVKLRGRDEVMIEPFPCYHTVPTCGYMIYKIAKRLANTIELKNNEIIEVNFQEDQPIKEKNKKCKKSSKIDVLYFESESENESEESINNEEIKKNNSNQITEQNNDVEIKESINNEEIKEDNCNQITKQNNADEIEKSCDQVTGEKSDQVTGKNSDQCTGIVIEECKESEKVYFNDWKLDPKYKDLIDFSERHNVEIVPNIIDVPIINTKNNKIHILKRRTITFPNGISIAARNDQNECILKPEDFKFFAKYKIDINIDHHIPDTMFFGDTCSYVFTNKQVNDLIKIVPNVIIECTFLENKQDLNQMVLKKREKKRHMFLCELEPIFKNNPNTKFLLIHISARYDIEVIKKYIDNCNAKYKNVIPFI
jgi:hypothetical protein